jgi:hypothetical protein
VVLEKPTTEKRETETRRICGLRVSFFYSLIVTAVILLAAIVSLAAGLGTAKHSSSKTSSPNQSPSTTTPSQSSTTSTQSSEAAPSTTPVLMTCAGNGTSHTASTGAIFQLWCNYDFTVNSDNNMWDYRGIGEFGACIDACSLWNEFQMPGGTCKSVTYGTTGSDNQHCWLKSVAGSLTAANGVAVPVDQGRQSANLISDP